MIFGDREGPKEIVIPEKRVVSCAGCKYYDYHMVQSGMRPVYASVCTHESSPMNFDGNLHRDYLNADMPVPGSWCPFPLQMVKRDEKIDEILNKKEIE